MDISFLLPALWLCVIGHDPLVLLDCAMVASCKNLTLDVFCHRRVLIVGLVRSWLSVFFPNVYHMIPRDKFFGVFE